MSVDTTEIQENEICAAVVITTIETARSAIAGLGKAAPAGAVRGLDIAIASMDRPGTPMGQVADDLRFRACNLHIGDSYQRQCAHALAFATAFMEIFLERE